MPNYGASFVTNQSSLFTRGYKFHFMTKGTPFGTALISYAGSAGFSSNFALYKDNFYLSSAGCSSISSTLHLHTHQVTSATSVGRAQWSSSATGSAYRVWGERFPLLFWVSNKDTSGYGAWRCKFKVRTGTPAGSPCQSGALYVALAPFCSSSYYSSTSVWTFGFGKMRVLGGFDRDHVQEVSADQSHRYLPPLYGYNPCTTSAKSKYNSYFENSYWVSYNNFCYAYESLEDSETLKWNGRDTYYWDVQYDSERTNGKLRININNVNIFVSDLPYTPAMIGIGINQAVGESHLGTGSTGNYPGHALLDNFYLYRDKT